MKVSPKIRAAFEQQHRINSELETRVSSAVGSLKAKHWHYESRLKQLESFAVKVESGMAKDPLALEDFLACVLVVPNLADLAEAEELILGRFELRDRRPTVHNRTSKKPSDFPFDDVRLYLRFGTDETLPPTEMDTVVFELQIRTFLQHAWTVATHDVVYKTDRLSWPRERVAHQAKAMLEHVELAVTNLEVLENSPPFPVDTDHFDAINSMIDVLEENWSGDQLPTDKKRLATSLLSTAKNVIGGDDFDAVTRTSEILSTGRAARGGSHNLDWSPARTVLEYLADEESTKLKKRLKKNSRSKLYVPIDLLERLGLSPADAPGATTIV
ncbi:hypothetical protein [Aeromicrobium sp. Leaf289]|uniref:hypothetical protein n=1 Tax=Aeromicrobium sp. Leaf289 TaxID=1736324 RepID=UPI000AC7F91E|nr:hypothetical protein [Aeromicrobium sp. Leaf289]